MGLPQILTFLTRSTDGYVGNMYKISTFDRVLTNVAETVSVLLGNIQLVVRK